MNEIVEALIEMDKNKLKKKYIKHALYYEFGLDRKNEINKIIKGCKFYKKTIKKIYKNIEKMGNNKKYYKITIDDNGDIDDKIGKFTFKAKQNGKRVVWAPMEEGSISRTTRNRRDYEKFIYYFDCLKCKHHAELVDTTNYREVKAMAAEITQYCWTWIKRR